MLCTYHLLPHGSTPGTPLGKPQEPRGNSTVLVFLFPCRGGELFGFGNDFPGPQDHTHGICSSFGQWYIALDQGFFFAPFYFIFMPNFDIMLWVFILPPKGEVFVINNNYYFIPFTQGL